MFTFYFQLHVIVFFLIKFNQVAFICIAAQKQFIVNLTVSSVDGRVTGNIRLSIL